MVGAGPNGLVAALTLAAAGMRVRVIEAASSAGGGTRTEALTSAGFLHDVCSAVHPLGVASPALRGLGLERHGLRWLHSPVPLAHPLGGERAAVLERSVSATADGLGADGRAYRRLMEPLVRSGEGLVDSLLSPLSVPTRAPVGLARYGMVGIRSATGLAGARFMMTRPARCSRGWPGTRCSRSTRRSPPGTGSCSDCSATSSAGRWRRAARRPSPMHWWGRSSRSGGRSSSTTV